MLENSFDELKMKGPSAGSGPDYRAVLEKMESLEWDLKQIKKTKEQDDSSVLDMMMMMQDQGNMMHEELDGLNVRVNTALQQLFGRLEALEKKANA